MRADVVASHDTTSLFLRWEIVPEGRERDMLTALGGPLLLEVSTSCLIDVSGVRHETAKVKVPIWPHPGERNIGQARFHDVDARRRFWVNLQDAVRSTVVDWLYATKPGSVAKEGVTLAIPELPSPASAPAASPAARP